MSPRTASGCRCTVPTVPVPLIWQGTGMSISLLGTLLFPTARAFSYLSPFEDQIWCWAGQEQPGCPQSPGACPWSNTHGDFSPWDARRCAPEPFCHAMTPTLTRASLMLCGHCPSGTLVALCRIRASVFCAFASGQPRFQQVSPPRGKSCAMWCRPWAAPSLPLPKNTSFYFIFFFLFFSFKAVFCTFHSSDF